MHLARIPAQIPSLSDYKKYGNGIKVAVSRRKLKIACVKHKSPDKSLTEKHAITWQHDGRRCLAIEHENATIHYEKPHKQVTALLLEKIIEKKR